jgi:hypothetical protein
MTPGALPLATGILAAAFAAATLFARDPAARAGKARVKSVAQHLALW